MRIPCVFVEYPELHAFKCSTCSRVFGYEEDETGGAAPHCGLEVHGVEHVRAVIDQLNAPSGDWVRDSKALNK